MPPIVLASSSPYRRALLERLGVPFDVAAPAIDETPRPRESVIAMVRRLAVEKAAAVAERHPGALVIGSDQAAALGRTRFGKPGDREGAIEQLERCQSRNVRFLTAIALHDTRDGSVQAAVETFAVALRPLSRTEIERYVDADRPFDCAGSFRAEGLGISLFRSMRGRDPTALIGLPLIRLCEMLRDRGIEIPA